MGRNNGKIAVLVLQLNKVRKIITIGYLRIFSNGCNDNDKLEEGKCVSFKHF